MSWPADQGRSSNSVASGRRLSFVVVSCLGGVRMKTDQKDKSEAAPATEALVPKAAVAPDAPLSRNAIQRRSMAGLMPTTLGEAMFIATTLARAKDIVPKSLQGNPEGVFAIILRGTEIGIGPMLAVNSIVNISGSLSMKADLQRGIVQRDGLLVYHRQGFEKRGKTDGSLEKRTRDHDVILSMVEDLAEGKFYGWCTAQRTGDPDLHSRVFTEPMAKTMKTRENGKTISLSDSYAYRNQPFDMYPIRAMTRVWSFLFSDAMSGIPASEAIDPTVLVDGTVVDAEVETVAPEDEIASMLGEISQDAPDVETAIAGGFEQLSMSPAARLQKLYEYRGRPQDLLAWLKSEWAGRQGKSMTKPDVLSADGPVEVKTTPPPGQDQMRGTSPAKASSQGLAELARQLDETAQPADDVPPADVQQQPEPAPEPSRPNAPINTDQSF